jgi:DNA-binding response OmpR family regulator
MSGSRVAIVDDDLRIRSLLEAELEDLGVSTICCNDGEALMALVQQQPIDLILLDLMMPNKDGLQCLKELQDLRYSGKVIVVSALSDDLKRSAAMERGASEYVIKTDIFDKLPAIVERHLPPAA